MQSQNQKLGLAIRETGTWQTFQGVETLKLTCDAALAPFFSHCFNIYAFFQNGTVSCKQVANIKLLIIQGFQQFQPYLTLLK
jgi:hypothetical protein